ncbi:hypothetical protein [Pseudomonas sp. HLT2-19-2]
MHVAIHAAGFSLMTMFVSCGVGAQELDTRIGKIAMERERPAHESIARQFYRGVMQPSTIVPTAWERSCETYLDLSFKYD